MFNEWKHLQRIHLCILNCSTSSGKPPPSSAHILGFLDILQHAGLKGIFGQMEEKEAQTTEMRKSCVFYFMLCINKFPCTSVWLPSFS